jgi:hypothetical protein
VSDGDFDPSDIECVHPIDHKGTSRLCLACQRAKDRRESDALFERRLEELREFVRRGEIAQEAIDRLLATSPPGRKGPQ